MKQTYMIVNELDVNKGGMTTAMLTRSKFFLDNEISGDIITFDFKANYKDILKELVQSKKMDKRTQMHNPFIYFKNISNLQHKKYNYTMTRNLSNLLKDSVEIEENSRISRFFNIMSGEYLAYKRETEQETIFDLFKNNLRYKRIYFYKGKIVKTEVFNSDNNLIAEQFYDDNGYLYLYRQINPEKKSIGKTYLVCKEKQFKNNVEFCSYFLDKLIPDINDNIIICDGPGSFPKILKTNHKNVKKFAVIHVNHYKNFDDTGAVKKQEDYILRNANKINGVVMLTEAQKKDIIEKYKITNAYVISNFINITDDYRDKNDNKVVGHISRLVPQKGLPYLIDVAKKVVEQDNSVEFHLYGTGEEKSKIENLIQESNLTNNVKLLGYTTNAIEKIKDFRCVISTSQFEGQGLSLIEAMLLKKPVVAFDVKYGPSDFVKDGKNGYLIENKDIKKMANKILKLLHDKELSKSLGKHGRDTIIDMYQPEKLMVKWKQLFN